MTYLHPGVYVEEIPSSVRVIEAGGTSTAAFLGIAEKGPTDEAVRLSNWSDFVKTFGSFIKESYLAYAVYGFFANGGTSCYVVRVNHGDAKFAATTLYTETGEESLEVKAASPGKWGNDLRLTVKNGTLEGEFDFEVYLKGSDDALEKFADLSMTDQDPNYVMKRVNGVSSYITVNDKAGPDSASFTSLVDLNEGVDLNKVFNIHLTVDGESALINLRGGETPPDDYSEVSGDYIIGRINEVFRPLFGDDVAYPENRDPEKYIRLISLKTGSESQIKFSTCEKDATEEVFGLVEYGWEKTGGIEQRTELLVSGVSDLTGDLPGMAGKKFTLTVGERESEITLPAPPAPCSLGNIIQVFNSAFADDPIATTDGTHLILNSTNKYLSVSMALGSAGSDQRDLLGKLFGRTESGNKFYGYQIDPPLPDGSAIIESDAGAASKIDVNKRYIRLKIDDEPALTLDVAEGFKFGSGAAPSLEDLRDAINRQVKKHTSIKWDVAKLVEDRLALTSPSKGSRSRLVFSFPGKGDGTDATHDLFGSTLSAKDRYVFVAETYKETPACLVSDQDLTNFEWTNLAGKQLRLAVSGCRAGSSMQFGFTFSATGYRPVELARQINSALDCPEGVARLSYEKQADGSFKVFLKLASPARGLGSFLRFSDPLGDDQQHKPTVNALGALFGPSLLEPIAKPGYGYEFSPRTRRPRSTRVVDNEKIPLRDGWHDHEHVEVADYFTAQIKGHSGAPIMGGIRLLDPIDEIRLLAIPMVSRDSTSTQGELIAAAMEFCALRKDCFYIADSPPEKSRDEISSFVKNLAASVGRDYAAIHYPWIEVSDPRDTKSGPLPIPPSGHVAGMYARTDGLRGVWKAPAGVEAGLANVIRTVCKVNDSDQDLLNPIGVNCIRQFPGAGIVNWGARTLAARTKPEWKYVPIRRTAIFLERSIFDGIQWAVFEPNNSRLWSALRLNIESFMNGLFRAGAFQGDKPSEAYFVRCGLGDTMTQVDIDLGRVIVLVGFAPLKPAEFVIVRIEQKAGQQ